MRRLLFLSLFLPLATHASDVYWFSQLVENAAKYGAPTELQSVMALAETKELLECQAERKLSDGQIHEYFSAIRLDLNGDGIADYLVFPSAYCFTYFGMHSTAFWLLLGQPNGGFKRVFEGRQDGVEILDTRHHGLKDFKTRYGNESELYRYGGRSYQPLTK